MIFDKVCEYKTYLGISEKLDLALEMMAEKDFSDIGPGKYDVCDGVYFMIFDMEPHPYFSDKWEAHHNYLDIHIPLTGAEIVGVRHVSDVKECVEYNPETDMEFFSSDSDKELYPVHAGEFLICFPNDVHIPDVVIPGYEHIKKLVIKVRV